MSIDQIAVGTSLVFGAQLSKADGAAAGRIEKNESHNVNGLVVPTPPDVWEKLQAALGLADRPASMRSHVLNMAYVPYKDGDMNFHEGNGTVLSGEFSGCLMASYTVKHQRRVAHIPTSDGTTDCKAAFRDLFDNNADYKFVQYFRPFSRDRDSDKHHDWIVKLLAAKVISSQYRIQTLGIVAAPGDVCHSIVVAETGTDSDTAYHVLEHKAYAPTKDLRAFAGLKTLEVVT